MEERWQIMGDYQNPNRRTIQRSNGFFQDLTNRFRLIGRLLMDQRVNPLLKLLPVGTLIYVVSPVDLLPLNPVDDALIVWIGTQLFVELCPPEVVEEHLRNMERVVNGRLKNTASTSSSTVDEDIVDGEFTEIDSNEQK
jgi:hypothetical protein